MAIWKLLRTLVLTSIICAVGTCSRSSSKVPEEVNLSGLPYASKLQDAIDHVLLADQGNHELGISAAVVVPGYRTWTGCSGISLPGVPIKTDMLLDAGSIEKNFEAALALKLAEDGALDLDDPISKFLPSYPNVDRNITIRQLLNHTSGVFNVFEHPDFPWVGAGVDYSKNWKLEEVIKSFVLEPYGPPGYAQHYSSTNYLLLTAIIEKVSEASVPDKLERHFLKPLKLEHTFVSMGQPPPEKFSVAHPWVDFDQDGKLDDLYGIPLTWKATLTHPVMFSTPGDLARWMQALYHERTVLSPDSLAEMLTYPKVALRDPGGGIYGLGVVDYSDLLGVRVIGHGGSALGYSAAAVYLPEYGISMAWMVNTGESPRELADQFMTNAWSALSEVLRTNQKALPTATNLAPVEEIPCGLISVNWVNY